MSQKYWFLAGLILEATRALLPDTNVLLAYTLVVIGGLPMTLAQLDVSIWTAFLVGNLLFLVTLVLLSPILAKCIRVQIIAILLAFFVANAISEGVTNSLLDRSISRENQILNANEEYKAGKGTYPENLQGFLPGHLDSIPSTGQGLLISLPWKYGKLDTTFCLGFGVTPLTWAWTYGSRDWNRG